MDFTFSADHLQALSNLLSCSDREEEELDEEPCAGGFELNPGQIGPPKESNPTAKADSKPEKPSNPKQIWAEVDVPEGSEFEDIWDPRKQPEYEILFKQRVGTEDVFLGMSRKDNSTACCEDMVIKIKLPDCKPADVTLDIKERFLALRSPDYKLGLHLPHSVDSKNGKARFNTDTQTLEITLTMKREFDFINFA
ncbi:protein PIH1D3 [Stegostoma tigrinum]|uniref:protein PIH1D3 n=1 Tax=Stegostoma tigrinum TaxID=3053191 RepID=UPI00202AEDC8|nr:protein PIH1D3 [Stegostoma tigrinum]XP_048400335.1 protein PIH1D3 [Stegostoma tigrinum]XP_048400336.1 protein PIH1D3 [Stegostoma tigrinum]XP_048400337.1 protein PIH1D3 [Stegostoma tigrinum]